MCAREVPSSTLEYIHKQNKLQVMFLSSLTLVKNTVSKPFWIDTNISVHCLEIWPFLLCQMQHWDCFISPDALLISLWRLWAYSPTLVIYLRACQVCKWNRSFFPFKSLQLHCCHTLPGNVWRGKKTPNNKGQKADTTLFVPLFRPLHTHRGQIRLFRFWLPFPSYNWIYTYILLYKF